MQHKLCTVVQLQEAQMNLRIGSLAHEAGVGVETIRYYQRRRLLGEPTRPFGGQRAYSVEDVGRVRFIKRAQALGFSLDEIAELLKLDAGTGHVRARTLAEQRLREIETKIADLTAMREVLRDLVHRCEQNHGKVACPIIAAFRYPEAIGATPPRKRARKNRTAQ
jgi:MerR family transcriptional regulator, mercuric resistance operon regulatory protein